jgi:hypothetical protein
LGQLRLAIVGDRDQRLPGGTLTSCRFRASFFFKPSIGYQPNFPIPGDKFDIFATADAFEPAHQAPDYMGQTFTALSKLWIIVQECLAVYNMEDGAPLVERVNPSFAEAKYQQLLAWADNLSPSLSNNLNSAAHAYLLQYKLP